MLDVVGFCNLYRQTNKMLIVGNDILLIFQGWFEKLLHLLVLKIIFDDFLILKNYLIT